MDSAHKETDQLLAKMERHLHSIYSRASKELGENWKEYMREAAVKIEPLEKSYQEALKSGDKDAIRKAENALEREKKAATIEYKHYNRMTEQLAEELAHVNETAAAYVNDRLPDIYVTNYNHVAQDVGAKIGGYSFELADANTVKRLATQVENLLPYKIVDGEKTVRWNVQAMNSEVLQGIIQGESMNRIANRLSKVVGMDERAAIRNARTSVTGAENRGRMDMMQRAKSIGVNMNKIWSSAHDRRVRDAHLALDGTEKAPEEPFANEFGEIMYPGDPDAAPANVYNCRCSLIYNVIGFGNSEDDKK